MTTTEEPVAPATRWHYLDWLRTAAVLLLIPYHSSRIFDIWEGFYVKNAQTSAPLTLIRALVDPWGMPLLFVVAGAASWLALRRRSGAQYLRERILRLPVPLVIGLFLLVPPQAYLGWLGRGNTGSFWGFFPAYWAMRTGEVFGFDGGFTLGHLWFILFLFVFSLLGLPIFLFARSGAGSRAVGRIANLCRRPVALWLFVIPLWLTEALPDLGGMNPFAFFQFFVAGAILLSDARFHEAIDRAWRWALAVGAVTLAAVVAVRFSGVALADFSWQSTAHDLLRYTATWSWVLGLMGLGRRHLNQPHRRLSYLNTITYPFYILHQTVILFVGFAVVRWPVPILAKFVIIALLSFAATLGLCELARRWSVTRTMLGIKAPRRPAAQEARFAPEKTAS
jgi:glucan biosynthesis protein C